MNKLLCLPYNEPADVVDYNFLVLRDVFHCREGDVVMIMEDWREESHYEDQEVTKGE